MTTVLVTRPAQAAAHVVESLHKRGYFTVIEPLLTIVPTGKAKPSIKNLHGVIMESRNAIAALTLRRDECDMLTGLACYCAGERTAEAARAFGFRNVILCNDGTSGLVSVIRESAPAGSRLMHITGNENGPELGKALSAEGKKLALWVVYEIKAAEKFSLSVHQKLVNGKIDAALFFSRRAAAQFVNLTEKSGLRACCERLTAIGINATATSALKPLPWRRLEKAAALSEEAMIACLQRHCPA